MLYVFDVDAGLMTTYDMSLTLESVASLKLAIERKTKIPASLLVLLVSGGDVLQSHHKVSSYSAGTDTNPIYMFSKPSVKDGSFKQPSQYSVCDLSPIVELSMEHWRSDTRSGLEMKSVSELKQAVEMSYALPPSVSTVVHCANLAQQFSELAHDMARCCEQHVHDQHLQHQGWSAVVANLEDIFNEFCERSKNFKENFKKHRQKKERYHELLKSLNEVLEYLGRIPILPGLRQNAEAHRFSAFDVYEDANMVFEGHCDRLSGAFDNSGENRIAQDFGVDALKISEDDVFATQKQHSQLDPKMSDQSSAECGGRIEESDEDVAFKAHSFENKEEATLLHWILAQGNNASLQDIIDYCQKGLTLMDADPLKEREAELYKILEYANMHGLKQIRGIEERLRGLEMLISDVRKLERDQHDQAQSLIQNRERVSNTVCDPSVLTTLVQSHRCQLETLLKNHQKLIDIRRRIAKSKEELSHILKARLEAVLMIENSMSVQDAHQMLSFQCFNRLARYFDIVEQLHRAPSIFAHAVNEVTRRRRFSDAFLTWTANLATNLLTIHDEEVSRRQEFNSKFHGHFLKTLFPGMGDLPPAFATQAPPYFDTKIPRLTDEDVDFVANSFPDLVKDVPRYDMESTSKFFNYRFTLSASRAKSVDVQTDTNRDFESETEGGDFERLSGQTTSDNKRKIDISTICVPDTNAVSTVTEKRSRRLIDFCSAQALYREIHNLLISDEEDRASANIEFVDADFYIEESLPSSLEWGRDDKDNMDTHRIDMEKLREIINNLFIVYKSNMINIKEELTKLKSEIEDQKKFIYSKYIEILEAWEKNNEENALKFREQTQRLTVDHELELTDLKNVLGAKEENIEILKKQMDATNTDHKQETERLSKDHECTKEVLENTREELKAYEVRINEMEVQKQKELKELQEKMHLEYKAEIESLRSRFRLVALTNMDRSPSESSLEKIERTDVIEIASHNAIVMQTKENAEVEKEEAIRETKEKCETEWKEKMDEEIGQLKVKFEAEKQVTINETTRRLLSEKDRQIEGLREREAQLLREVTKYKQTIQQLADQDTDCDTLLKTQVATLESENAELQKQIDELKVKIEEAQKKSDDSEKIQEGEGENTNPRTSIRSWSHTPVGLAGGTLSVSACLPGHVVLLLWDPPHRNYTVLQEAPVMYFVHSDCLAALDLSITVETENERKLYAVAIVESKEYCYAKRNANRYHMPRGSRFYRVRVKPYRQHPTNPPCCDYKHKQDSLKGAALPVFGEQRPVKKWLTYMHAPDSQKSAEQNQAVTTTQTTTENPESPKVEEVEIAPLINLESPVGSEEPLPVTDLPAPAHEDELDSIETNDWSSRMMQASCLTDMECSVGHVIGPEMELPSEQLPSSFVTRAGSSDPPDSELAEEATP